MRFLLPFIMVLSLLAATFAASAASPVLDSGSGCVTIENGEFCIDPAMVPAKGNSAEKPSKCLGPYLASSGMVLSASGGHVHVAASAVTDDGLSPSSPKRPPRA
ncbi:hypothetical protein [Aliihoeflea sp. PC F10.4]